MTAVPDLGPTPLVLNQHKRGTSSRPARPGMVGEATGASRSCGRGRDMLTGLPKTVVITSEEIRRALDEPVTQIVDAIKSTLDKTPPELAADIMDRGIVLAGGGALLQGLDERLRHETQMPVHLAESPLTCVAVGSGRSLEEFEVIHRSNRSRARRNGSRR